MRFTVNLLALPQIEKANEVRIFANNSSKIFLDKTYFSERNKR